MFLVVSGGFEGLETLIWWVCGDYVLWVCFVVFETLTLAFCLFVYFRGLGRLDPECELSTLIGFECQVLDPKIVQESL